MQGMVSSSLVAVAFGIGIGYYIAGRAMKAKPKDTRRLVKKVSRQRYMHCHRWFERYWCSDLSRVARHV